MRVRARVRVRVRVRVRARARARCLLDRAREARERYREASHAVGSRE